MAKKIEVHSSKSVNVFELSDNEFDKKDIAQSSNISLPDSFTIPENPTKVEFEYTTLKDNEGKNRRGIGIVVTLKDNTEKAIPLSSLTRQYLLQRPETNENGEFESTRNLPRVAVLEPLQDAVIFQMRPSEILSKISGKTYTVKEKQEIENPTFGDGKVNGYTRIDKNIYSVVTTAETT